MLLRYAAVTIVCITGFTACNKFEYSPYQNEVSEDMPSNLTEKNLAKLKSNEANADDTVIIVYSGDCQRFYDQLHQLVTKVNTLPNVDFLIMSGDIADFGILKEYLWINREFDKLNVPFLTAIGNHDLATDNGEVYTKIFGLKNYSFIYKGYKFLFHDTNGREYGFNGSIPNMFWLQDQVNDSTPHWFVGVSHVPPYNVDFDPVLQYPYKNLFRDTPGFILSLHGHIHDKADAYYYSDSVRYMTSNSVEKNEAILLKLINGQIIKQMIEY
jgi:Icc protein